MLTLTPTSCSRSDARRIVFLAVDQRMDCRISSGYEVDRVGGYRPTSIPMSKDREWSRCSAITAFPSFYIHMNLFGVDRCRSTCGALPTTAASWRSDAMPSIGDATVVAGIAGETLGARLAIWAPHSFACLAGIRGEKIRTHTPERFWSLNINKSVVFSHHVLLNICPPFSHVGAHKLVARWRRSTQKATQGSKNQSRIEPTTYYIDLSLTYCGLVDLRLREELIPGIFAKITMWNNEVFSLILLVIQKQKLFIES